MGKFEIDKRFDFCYGHRVWSQELDEDFCARGDSSCACRHPHGHQGHVFIYLESDKLERGMVTDFKHLGWMKNFIDDNLDHKFIIDRNDPGFNMIVNGHIENDILFAQSGAELALVEIVVPGTDLVVGHTLDTEGLSGFEQEIYEGYFIVDFVPTSENLCLWLHAAASEKMSKMGIKVSKVLWQETPKSQAVFMAD